MFCRPSLNLFLFIAAIGTVFLLQMRGQGGPQNVEALSGPAPSLDFFDAKESLLKIPIKPFAFTREEIPFDLDPRPEMFDPVKAGQQADAIDLGLRTMVRNRASDAELRIAVDKLVRWAQKMERLQSQYYAGGLAALDALAERSPRDSKVLARCATRWVDAVEVERMEVLATVKPALRGESNNMADVRVDPQTYLWRYPKATPNDTKGPVSSAAFPRAQIAIQRALSADPSNTEALFASAMLSRRQYGAGDDAMLSALSQASQSTGSYAEAARLYVLGRDHSYTSELQARVDKLREVIRGPGTERGVIRADGTVYTVGSPGPIIKAPTARDLAQADALDAKIKQSYGQKRAQIDNLLRHDPTNAEMFVVLSNTYRSGTIGERVLRYALMLNPGDYRLYWLRVTALAKGGNWFGGEEDFGPHNMGEASDYAQWVLRKGQANDEQHCGGLASEIAKKYYKDPFTYYTVALHCVHMEPDRPGPRRALVIAFIGMSEPTIVGSEMPDAREQGQLESEVMYQIAARRLEHPNEWVAEESKTTVVQWMALAKYFRGQHTRNLHRDEEARQYFLQALKLDPAATPAQKVLDQMSKQ